MGGSATPPPAIPIGRYARAAISSIYAPIALVGLSLFALLLHGRDVRGILWTNLPTPLNSSGARIVDLTRPSTPRRIYRFAFEAHVPARAGAVPHLQVQVLTEGRLKPIVVEREAGDGSRIRGVSEILRGRARLQVVSDRDWLDLGPFVPGEREVVQAVGLLPGPFSLADIDASSPEEKDRPVALRVLSIDGTSENVTPRVRIVQAAPVSGEELLARLLFFARSSTLVLLGLLFALLGLLVGWVLLSRDWPTWGIGLLTSSVVLGHALLLPPLHGADETSQAGTIEWLVWNPRDASPEYPASVAQVAQILEQDRVQFHSREALPLEQSKRAELARLLRTTLSDQARMGSEPPPAATVQVVALKGPLFYDPFLWLQTALRQISILDRLVSYRLIATVWGLLAFLAGLAFAKWARLSLQARLLYGLAFLLPNSVAVTASCSNYAPAIGVGFLIASGALAAVLAEDVRRRVASLWVILGGSWLGVGLWPDFVTLALVATPCCAVALIALWRRRRGRSRPSSGARGVSLLVLCGAALVVAVLSWLWFPTFDARLPAIVPRPGEPRFGYALALVVLPVVFTALIAFVRLWRRGAPRVEQQRTARLVSLAIAGILVLMFAATPFSRVPYERTFLPLPQLVGAYLRAFWSNNFSWDQDTLSWKLWFGAFGWHDVFYAAPIYALARWGSVALLSALPILTLDFARRRPVESSALLMVSGIALSLAAVSQLVRHALSIHPQGRFFLPYLALAVLPVLVQVEKVGRTPALVLALRAAVALQVWTAVAVLGERYLLPG